MKCFDDKRYIVIAKHFAAREIAASFAAIFLCKECSRTLSIYYYYSRKSAVRAKENNIISLFLPTFKYRKIGSWRPLFEIAFNNHFPL